MVLDKGLIGFSHEILLKNVLLRACHFWLDSFD